MLVFDICTPEEEVLSCGEELALASRSGILERHCLGTPTCQASCIYPHVNLQIALLCCQGELRGWSAVRLHASASVVGDVSV
jgi:hypothetical protein